MPAISVHKLSDTMFEVTVEGRSTTVHTVTVPPEYAAKLTGSKATVELLLYKSFEFLLERESNTSILRRFDLPVIGRYFPEYEREIGDIL